ncbi:MAG: hypothetical protein AAGE80_10775 [Pseudomonadota bacterium]
MIARFAVLTVAAALMGCAGDGSGGSARIETFEISGGPQRYLVDVLDQGQGNRMLIVRSAGFRGFDRGEGDLAFRVAGQAAAQAQCAGGRGIGLIPSSARFQDETANLGPGTGGRNVWIFQGKCGG